MAYLLRSPHLLRRFCCRSFSTQKDVLAIWSLTICMRFCQQHTQLSCVRRCGLDALNRRPSEASRPTVSSFGYRWICNSSGTVSEYIPERNLGRAESIAAQARAGKICRDARRFPLPYYLGKESVRFEACRAFHSMPESKSFFR